MSKFTKAEEKLLIQVVQECVLHDVTLVLSNTLMVTPPDESDDGACSGFFDSTKRLLSVGTHRPVGEWLRVLLHEYGHLQQWIEDPEKGEETDKILNNLFLWLDKKCEMTHGKVVEACQLAVGVELDCEDRTVKTIQELGLNWDIPEYIRGANSYLYLYPVIAEVGKWCSVESPYRIRELVEMMPAFFLPNPQAYFDVPEEVKQLIIEKCMPQDEED